MASKTRKSQTPSKPPVKPKIEPSIGFIRGNVYPAEITLVEKARVVCTLAGVESSISISGVFFNAKTKRTFLVGDHIEIIITKLSPLEVCLTKEFMRPLLIFDMHGVLGEREPYKARVRKRKFIRRPYCEEFISLCSRYFELAVWSCGMKKNLDLSIFDSVQCLFVWCQDESTNLYPRTSEVSADKVCVAPVCHSLLIIP
jgi:hypothetical protein